MRACLALGWVVTALAASAAAAPPDGAADSPDGGAVSPDAGDGGAAACAPVDKIRGDAAEAAWRALAPEGVKPERRVVFGLALLDRPAALDALQRALAPKPTASWQNARRAACADVRCALTATLGSDEAARWFLVIAARTGAVPALDGYWRTGELRALARAVLELPPALLHLPTLKRFRRLPDGEPPPATPPAGAILLGGALWSLPSIAQRTAILRELARQFALSRGRPSRAPKAVDDFADAAAEARVRPRLQAALGHARPEVAALVAWERAAPDADLDALVAGAGGLLAPLAACARRSRYVPAPTRADEHASLMEALSAGTFSGADGCVEQLWDELSRRPAFAALACRRDPEELRAAFEARAADLFGALVEALEAARAEIPDAAHTRCLADGELTSACLAGDAARARAAVEARRLVGEFGDGLDQGELARLLVGLLPLWPTDAELFARYPALASPARLVAACLLGVDQLSRSDGGDGWRFRVGAARLALPTDRACAAHYPRALDGAQGARPRAVDEPLLLHLQDRLRAGAERLFNRFHREILENRGELERVCAVEIGARLPPAAAPCVEAWLRIRLERLLPGDLVAPVAARVAAALR